MLRSELIVSILVAGSAISVGCGGTSMGGVGGAAGIAGSSASASPLDPDAAARDPSALSCEPTGAIDVSGEHELSVFGLTLLADRQGWLVAWILEQEASVDETPGLYVARPASPPRHIDTGVDAMMGLTGVVTNSGFLLCWQPNGPPTVETSCVALDAALEVIHPPTQTVVDDVAELIPRPDGPLAVIDATHSAVPVDDFGAPVGPTVQLPCVPRAHNEQYLACVEPADSLCGSQFPPSGTACDWMFSLANYDGSVATAPIAVAPPPMWQTDSTRISAAAHADGFAVVSHNVDQIHVTALDDVGSPRREVDFSAAAFWVNAAVGAIPRGYLVSFTDGDAPYSFAVLDDTGRVLQAPTITSLGAGSIGPPIVTAASGGAWAAAWGTSEVRDGHGHSRIWFRSFGCGGPPYE